MSIAIRYFIFHYKCQNATTSMHGQYGTWGNLLPNLKMITEAIVYSLPEFKSTQVNILSFNEVPLEDYNNFFGKAEGFQGEVADD